MLMKVHTYRGRTRKRGDLVELSLGSYEFELSLGVGNSEVAFPIIIPAGAFPDIMMQGKLFKR